MAASEVFRELESMRTDLHKHFEKDLGELCDDLLAFADDLDEANKAIKKSKIAGSAGGIVGGVLGVVGFGLSFATFGASLGLCIAGAVIAGAGGVTSGGASVAEFVKAKAAKNKVKEKVDGYNDSTKELLKKFTDLSEDLCRYESIDTDFSSWASFWGKLVVGSGQVCTGLGCKIVANTVMNALLAGKVFDVAGDISSAAVPVVRTLGQAARGLHIAGGVVGAVFIPFDLYSLVSNSVELHKNTAHKDSERIRDIVQELNRKCPKAKEIDKMVDESKSHILEILIKLKQQLPGDFKAIRIHLYFHFVDEKKEQTEVLLEYANKLDRAYEGVPDDTYGVVAGANLFEAKDIGYRASEILNEYIMSTLRLFEKCEKISENLKLIDDIDNAFPSLVRFWIELVYGCGSFHAYDKWGLVSETVIELVREGNSVARQGNVFSVAVDVANSLRQTTRRFRKVGILFPADLYSIILKSENVFYNTAHKDANQIREIVDEIVYNCPSPREIDSMIDTSKDSSIELCNNLSGCN